MKKIFAIALMALLVVVGAQSVFAANVSVTPANASYLVLPAKTTAVDLDDTITITNSFVLLTNAGASPTTTNTLVAPAKDGLLAVIQVANGETNSSIIAEGSTAVLNGDSVTLTEGGNPLIVFSANSLWYEWPLLTGRSVSLSTSTEAAKPVWTQATTTPPTNTVATGRGLTVSVNGTNYVVALYIN